VSSRGVDALEGPEASGPISGPVKASEFDKIKRSAYEEFGKIKRDVYDNTVTEFSRVLDNTEKDLRKRGATTVLKEYVKLRKDLNMMDRDRKAFYEKFIVGKSGLGIDPTKLANPVEGLAERLAEARKMMAINEPIGSSTSKADIDPFKYDRSPSVDPSSLMAPPPKLYDNWIDAAAERIIQLEGFIGEAEIAFPGEKYPTVGYGKSDSTVQLGDIITETDALVELKKNLIPKKIATAKRLFPAFDTYSPNLKIELLQGVFRGNFKAKHNSVKLINKGEWEKASKEFLDYQEYRDAQKIGSNKRGVVFRMDSIADAIKDEEYYTANTANP